jgi:microcystin-dependent protein
MARTKFKVKEGISVSDDNSADGYPLIPVGSIIAYAGSTAPEGWLLCDGTAVSRTTYANLWALISSTYGNGNNSTTFNLPNLCGRMPIGVGTGSGLTARSLAATGGSETVVIASGNLPTHQHTINHDHASVDSGNQSADHYHSVNPPNTTSGNDNTEHTHAIDPPATSSGYISADHGHTSDTSYHWHALYYLTDAAAGTAKARATAASSTLGNPGGTSMENHYHGTGGVSANHYHDTDIGSFTSGGRSAYHQHDTDIAAFNSGTVSANHTHSVDLPSFSGDSGNGGFANTALALMNPFLAVNYIIKY